MSQQKADSMEVKKVEWNHKYKKYQVYYVASDGSLNTAFVNPMKAAPILNVLKDLRIFRNLYENRDGKHCEFWDLM